MCLHENCENYRFSLLIGNDILKITVGLPAVHIAKHSLFFITLTLSRSRSVAPPCTTRQWQR